jgi:hypothetical protein
MLLADHPEERASCNTTAFCFAVDPRPNGIGEIDQSARDRALVSTDLAQPVPLTLDMAHHCVTLSLYGRHGSDEAS